MEMQTRFITFLFVILVSSPSEEEMKNLAGAVGGSITLPDPVTEKGFLLHGIKTVSMVNNKKNLVLEDIYKDKLYWNEDTGLFTITDLQRRNSGIYTVDSKKELVFSTSYNLIVYDPAPSPAVETQTVSSDRCWLICSVDKQATLLWIKDEEIQNQNSSALSLPITVYKQDRNSSYRCVAANPAENKTLHVNMTTFCWFNKTESGDDNQLRDYWKVFTILIKLVVFLALTAAMLRLRYLKNKANKRS